MLTETGAELLNEELYVQFHEAAQAVTAVWEQLGCRGGVRSSGGSSSTGLTAEASTEAAEPNGAGALTVVEEQEDRWAVAVQRFRQRVREACAGVVAEEMGPLRRAQEELSKALQTHQEMVQRLGGPGEPGSEEEAEYQWAFASPEETPGLPNDQTSDSGGSSGGRGVLGQLQQVELKLTCLAQLQNTRARVLAETGAELARLYHELQVPLSERLPCPAAPLPSSVSTTAAELSPEVLAAYRAALSSARQAH
eukprot:RCo033118